MARKTRAQLLEEVNASEAVCQSLVNKNARIRKEVDIAWEEKYQKLVDKNSGLTERFLSLQQKESQLGAELEYQQRQNRTQENIIIRMEGEIKGIKYAFEESLNCE